MDYEKQRFERAQPVARFDTALAAVTYNLTRILLAESPSGSVFVPIRGMQYMAVIDAEEIIFVDSQYRRWVAVAWRAFKPQTRVALDEPVAYEAVFHTPEGAEIQRRIQTEFHKALMLLYSRRPRPREASILPLRTED